MDAYYLTSKAFQAAYSSAPTPEGSTTLYEDSYHSALVYAETRGQAKAYFVRDIRETCEPYHVDMTCVKSCHILAKGVEGEVGVQELPSEDDILEGNLSPIWRLVADRYWDMPCERCKFDEGEVIEVGERHYNYGASMDGGECYDWEEKQRCTNCGREWWVNTGNC